MVSTSFALDYLNYNLDSPNCQAINLDNLNFYLALPCRMVYN
nr:MAG TPA: hypothetical protein [Caudoviricetes sp.]